MSNERETNRQNTEETVEKRTMKLSKKESKKHKKAKGLNKIIKRGIILVSAVGLISIGAFNYAYNYVPTSSESLETKVSNIEDELLTSTIANSEDSSLVYKLEDNMYLGQTLTDLNLSSYAEGLKEIDSSNYTSEEIHALIKEFESLKDVDKLTPSKNSIRFFEIASILNDYNNNFSLAINENTVSAINSYAEALIKVSVIEALNLDNSCINNLSTNLTDLEAPFSCYYNDPTTGKVFDLTTSNFNNLNTLIAQVRKLNTMFNGQVDESGNVVPTEESKLVAQQTTVLNTIKFTLEFRCKVNNGVISEENNIIECICQKIKCK